MPPPNVSQSRAGPFGFRPSLPGIGGLGLVAGGLAMASYLLALITTVPIQALLQLRDEGGLVTDAAGTVWRGEAWLGKEHRLDWRFMPGESLTGIGPVWQTRLDSADTAMTAQISVQSRRLQADRLQGRAGWSLISLFDSTVQADCALSARMMSGRVSITRSAVSAEGEAILAPSSCQTPDGEQIDLPRLNLLALPAGDMARIAVRRDDGAGDLLAEIVLGTQGVVEVELTSEGAQVFGRQP